MGKSTSTHLVRLARTHILAWTPFSSTSMFDRPEYSTSNPLHQYTGHTNQRTETIPSLHLQSLSLPRATKDERDRETKDCLTDYLQTSRRDRENYVFTNVAQSTSLCDSSHFIDRAGSQFQSNDIVVVVCVRFCLGILLVYTANSVLFDIATLVSPIDRTNANLLQPHSGLR